MARKFLITYLVVAVFEFVGLNIVRGLSANPQDLTALSDHLAPLLLASALYTTALVMLATHSRLRAWPRFLALSTIYLSVRIFMVQNDLWFLMDALDVTVASLAIEAGSQLPGIVAASAIAAWLFAPKSAMLQIELQTSPWPWIWRMSLVSLLFLLAYFSAGLIVMNLFPFVAQFYADTFDEVNGFHILASQVLRGALWSGIVLFLLSTLESNRLRSSMITGFVLMAFFSTVLFYPNPALPLEIRAAHLLETSTSQFIFGFLAAFILFPLIRAGGGASEMGAAVGG